MYSSFELQQAFGRHFGIDVLNRNTIDRAIDFLGLGCEKETKLDELSDSSSSGEDREAVDFGGKFSRRQSSAREADEGKE